MIKAMQEWLKTCPLVAETLGEGVSFRINYLPEGAGNFSIEDSPTDPIVKQYFGGTRRIKNYLIASRTEYSPDVWLQAAGSAFWDSFTSWIETQSAAGNLPELGAGRTPLRVAVTDSGYVYTSEDGKARWQIQIQLLYDQSR
jgi:hypothetical protein